MVISVRPNGSQSIRTVFDTHSWSMITILEKTRAILDGPGSGDIILRYEPAAGRSVTEPVVGGRLMYTYSPS